MRRMLLLLLLSMAGTARADDLGAAVRAADWSAATLIAAGAADPIAGRLVRYLRALSPGAAGAGEILDEMAAEPDWPQSSVLARRYADTLANERDDQAVNGWCQRRAPVTATAMLRCAAVTARGDDMARQAWLLGITDPPGEITFMKRWGAAIGPAVQFARFERLAWSEGAAPAGPLARQAVRVDPAMRPTAEALLALKRGDAAGPDLFAGLPPAMQAQPILILELARWFRRAEKDNEAAQVWAERGAAAELAAPPTRRAAFWTERNILARALLRSRQDALAYTVVTSAPDLNGDALFLAGWIALRRLDQPVVAAGFFRTLAGVSTAVITQGRAMYWLGRALSAAGQVDEAKASYRRGAAWPTSYYGQLAALAAGDDIAMLEAQIRSLADPAWDESRALDFAGSDMARAATLLVAWGQRNRAKPFLGSLETSQADPAGRSIVGRLAAALGMPDQAVAMARLAGRDGVMLPEVGWPDGVEIPPGRVERAVGLGVIRQESSFDAAARSPVGAVGLMQLMPATAAQVSRALGGSVGDLTDPAANVRLGTAYLGMQLDRFGTLPPALAAYNAGPNRARDWLLSIGDPASGAVDPIDWVELIPFDETRNYVQRIVENVMIYRARGGVVLPHPVLVWGRNGI